MDGTEEDLGVEDDEEDYDDIGLGVTRTVASKTKPRVDDITGEAQNPILEIAEAAQDIADSMLPPDYFEKFKRKPGSTGSKEGTGGDRIDSDADTEGDSDGSASDSGVAGDDGNLGMGLSESVAPKAKPGTSFGADSRSFSRGMEALLGAGEQQEMERLRSRDSRRAEMEQRGLSPEQIAAYLGDDLSVSADAKKELREADQMSMFQDAAFEDIRTMEEDDAKLGVVASSSVVKLDENGEPYRDRFVYVDEYTCIGCTHCSHTAPGTFFMEPDHGRARVYQQEKDTNTAIREAIMTCPVDCIHYVGWKELRTLEGEREGLDINFKARLVGNDHDNVRNGQQTISGNQGMRCDNCPSKGCYNCPMYGVGFNPAYLKRKEESKARRKARMKKEEEELRGPRSVDL